MPFKSKAQWRKFAHLLVEGKIKDETFEEWNRSTGRKDLPERVRPKKGATKSKRKPAKAKTKIKIKTKSKTKSKPATRRSSRG